ncbi:MAG: flagellar type III secretion system protein FliR [Parvibaculaceae bacterium]|nr:flagellar type III secretion system protein FliR [Parvibaculaceae bacterium]
MNFELDLLPQFALSFILVFARIGTMIMLMPAFGERTIPAQFKLTFALMLSAVMLPLVASSFGDVPSSLFGLSFLVIGEIMTGGLVGMVARLVMSALQVAGTVIAFQTGLAFAQNMDPTQGVQSALVGSFMSMLAVTLIFVMDFHYLLIAAMQDSYTLFVPGQMLPVGDFVKMAVDVVAGSFQVALQIAAPFIVFGLIFNLALGLLSRLMPQLQVYFIAMPANILIGFALFMILMGSMMMWFLNYFEETMSQFLV